MNDERMNWEEAVVWLKQQPNNEELVKACFYDDDLLNAAIRYYESTEWAEIANTLPNAPGLALDIGAGRGIASYALAKSGFSVVALEPNPSAIVGAGAIQALSDESGLDIIIERSWGERLPFDSGVFDVVHARQVLHHAQDLKQLCAEACRVLKKGGLFIATREHVISNSKDLATFLEAHPLHHLYGGEHAYELKEYIAAIETSGIELVSVLNPFESDINLYPNTKHNFRSQLASRYRLPTFMIPDAYLKLKGNLCKTPGRLYSFVGYRA